MNIWWNVMCVLICYKSSLVQGASARNILYPLFPSKLVHNQGMMSCICRVEFILTAMFAIDVVLLLAQETSKHRLVMPFRCLRLAALHCKAKNVGHISRVCLSVILKLGKVIYQLKLFLGNEQGNGGGILQWGRIGGHTSSLIFHFLMF